MSLLDFRSGRWLIISVLTSILSTGLNACGDDDGGGSDGGGDGGGPNVEDGSPRDAMTGGPDGSTDATVETDSGTDAAPGDAGMKTPIALVDNPSADACGAPADRTLEQASVAEGHCAWVFATGLGGARGMVVDSAGQVLVIARNDGRVVALHDDDDSRAIEDGERTVLTPDVNNLNHGIWIHDGHLYASSPSTVYRWPYAPGTTSPLTGAEEVVRGIPGGGHSTRTLIAKDQYLYVSIGSGGNVDSDSSRARVMRYDLGAIPNDGYEWTTGELFADGLRNEVALGFDSRGRLWGAQNGVDNLFREDLGGDIHDDNPAEEVNLFDEPGRFHGYPYCWAEFLLPENIGMGATTEWAHPSFMDDGTHDDAWCRDPVNVVRSKYALQAHSAPLDILFYAGAGLAGQVAGDAFVSLHGSWNRPVPTGYKVMRLITDGDGMPIAEHPFLEHSGAGDIGADWPHRPVALAIGRDGELFVTSDRSNLVIAIAKTQ